MTESTKHDAIYLQLCDDEDSEWFDTVTWCQDRVHESDVKYIRADLVESLRQQLILKEHQYDVMKASAEVLAEQCDKMRQQLSTLKAELKCIGEAIDDPRTDLTMTMSEVIVDQKQQLAAAQEELEAERIRRFEGNRISSKEYNDSQKREVMLRQELMRYGEHEGSCSIVDLDADGFHCECDCGLSAILNSTYDLLEQVK